MAWIRCNKKGSGSATLITKSITQNGTYNASSDGADGYSQVIVNTPSAGLNTTIFAVTSTTYTQGD